MGFRFDPARPLLAFVAAVLAASALGGCYTVLKHPRADVTESGAALPAGTQQMDFAHRDCYDCHRVDGPAHAYDPLAAPAFGYYDDALYGYYAYPWWHRNYWESDDYGYGGGWRDSLGFRMPVSDDSRRHLWGRGDGLPSYLPPIFGGEAGGGAGGAAPGGTTGTTGAPPTTQEGRTMKPGSTPAPPTVPPAPPTPPDKKKDDKKKDGKTDVWGRGGGNP